MKTEAYFVPHCDDNQECDLGAFWYTCPSCGKKEDDYEIWWKQDELWIGHKFTFICPNCGDELVVEWNQDDCCFYVIKIENNEKKI